MSSIGAGLPERTQATSSSNNCTISSSSVLIDIQSLKVCERHGVSLRSLCIGVLTSVGSGKHARRADAQPLAYALQPRILLTLYDGIDERQLVQSAVFSGEQRNLRNFQ